MWYKNVFLKYIRQIVIVPVLGLGLLPVSCKKYLDKKPSQGLAIPSSLGDLQAVLDDQVANNYSLEFLEFVADNYYLSTTSWNNLNNDFRKNYTWDSDAQVINENPAAWNNPYHAIYEANFVLDNLAKIAVTESERGQANSIKGTALFYRSFMFQQLSQLYCKPYSTTAGTDMGIILRTTADVEAPLNRATVEQTYNEITNDLKTAAELLPGTTLYSTRPNKASAYALLSRVYLSMRDYVNAELYADKCLAINNSLLDYNSLAPAGNPVLPANPLNNIEILYLSGTITSQVFDNTHAAIVDTLLYQSYPNNDLRKSIYFGSLSGGKNYWKGSYNTYLGDYSIFDGIATDEVYLIRAESRVRNGNVSGGLSDLNTLLQKRWKTGTFSDVTATNAPDAINKILIERRKELAFRGTRWSDLRRLNAEGANTALQRIVNGTTYTLPPNDLRWVLLIPEQEISRSKVPQNPR